MKTCFLFISLIVFATITGCEQNEDAKRPAPDVDLGGFGSESSVVDMQNNIYKIDYEQRSDGSYQNPVIEKVTNDGKRLWKVTYEESSVDGRGVLLTMDTDGNTPIAVFTVDGGSYDDKYITKHHVEQDAFADVYQKSYAAGGGPKAVVLAKINPATGSITKATFLTARKNDGKTNGFGINEIKVTDEAIILMATVAAWPPGEGSSYQRFPDITDADRVDGWFKMYYEISKDLSKITRAEIFVQ